MYQSLGEYGKAEENQRKALVITKEIGDKEGEATCYGNLGTVHHSLGEYGKAEEYQRKHFSSEKKLVTEKEKLHVMETLELCISLSVNMEKLKNIKRKHL